MGTGRIEKRYLLAALLILVCAIVLTLALGRERAARDANVKADAAGRMAACMERIRAYKAARNLPLAAEDVHETKLINNYFTEITTTVGDIGAKRTVSDPDMAAVMVELLTEAGVRAGDTVAAGFSGSFPGMNLATICACEAIGARLIYISSVGASMYGANQVALTFPDMAYLLAADGMIETYPAAFSMGGDGDCGQEMEPTTAEEVRQRIRAYGIPFLAEPDLGKNLALRRAIYEKRGPVACYVGVGGNVTNSGKNGSGLASGIVPPTGSVRLNADSGLLDTYHAEGVPVINIINIKELAAEYGFAFDPEGAQTIGDIGVYRETAYPLWTALAGISLALGVLLYPRLRKGRAA